MTSSKKSGASGSGTSPGKTVRRQPKASRSPGHRRLNCPFNAKFPYKPRGSNSSCQGNGFESNARLVEHLKRAHKPLEHNGGAAGPVVTAPSGLTQAPSVDHKDECLTREQLTLIAKLPRNSNRQEKWGSIYKIIFPNDVANMPAYMASAEQLRDFARDRPEWLVAELTEAIGTSQKETIILMKNFLIFFDIVGGSQPSEPSSTASPASTQPERSSTGSDSVVSPSLVDGTTGAIDHWLSSSLDDRMTHWSVSSLVNETYVFNMDDST